MGVRGLTFLVCGSIILIYKSPLLLLPGAVTILGLSGSAKILG